MQNTQAINVTAGNATATGSVTVSDNMPGVPCPDPAGYKYVGARYVPLFADPAEWNINSTYEPLTIVINEGNSYTSKQFVPVGIQIDNEEYWALTGNYNAQVEEYRQTVLTFDKRITANEKAISVLSNRVFGLIGDSFSEPTSGRYDWVGEMLPYLLGVKTVYNQAFSGAGFIGGKYAQQHRFIDQLNQLYNTHPELTDIIFYGGNNDLQYLYDPRLNTAVNDFIKRLNATFPKARVHFFLTNFNCNSPKKTMAYQQLIEFSISSIKPTFIPSFYNKADTWLFDLNAWRSSTDAHPSDGGRQYIAMQIASCINGLNMSLAMNHDISPIKAVDMSVSTFVFDNGCILGNPFTFKVSEVGASIDIFSWKTPLNYFKPFQCVGIAGQNVPCLLYVDGQKATLYFSSSDTSKITANSTVITVQFPTMKIVSTLDVL